MDGIVLGMLILVSATDASPALECRRAAIAPVTFSYELPERASTDWPGRLSRAREAQRPHGLVRFSQATNTKRSRVDRIIAVAAGASIGWVVGGGIGYAVTPKRGPYDDTSGLKGVMIGAPIGGVVGALIGYRLTR